METLSPILTLSVNDPLHDVPNIFQKCITWSRNTLRRFKLTAGTLKCATLGIFINEFSLFGERPFT